MAKKRSLWIVRIHRVGDDRLFSTGFASVDEIVIKTLGDEDRVKEAEIDS